MGYVCSYLTCLTLAAFTSRGIPASLMPASYGTLDHDSGLFEQGAGGEDRHSRRRGGEISWRGGGRGREGAELAWDSSIIHRGHPAKTDVIFHG
jgi:hypothetical protein